ncbi:hypothetical protein [Peijinzhouia sedimentorum]
MINYLEPNVVIVDDVREEIQGIYEFFSQKGIGCKVFNPDLVDGDSYPLSPYSDVSLIFLDLHYSNVFDSELCAGWVRQIVKQKSFFILIMWTKDQSKAIQVSELLTTHNCTPFLTIVKSKIDFQVPNENKYNFDILIEDLNRQLEATPALEEILIWKKSVKQSSNEIIGNLTKNPNSLVDKLKKVIISHGGTSLKESNDYKYKRSILFDALDTVLISNTKKNVNTVISELNQQSLYNLQEVNNSDADKELNSWFHFKIDNEVSQSIITPGLISKNNHRFFKQLYSIQDDPKLIKLFEVQNQNNIKIEDIVLVISRPCDIAQKKFGKNIKLLSGIIIYNAFRNPSGKRKNEINFNNLNLPDSLKKYEHLYFSDLLNDVTIMFDFRYSFSVPEKIFLDRFENIKIFNKELLSEIQVEYSSYSSRLGITQIL